MVTPTNINAVTICLRILDSVENVFGKHLFKAAFTNGIILMECSNNYNILNIITFFGSKKK